MFFNAKNRFLEHASEVLGFHGASRRGPEAGRSVQESPGMLQDASTRQQTPWRLQEAPRRSHGGPRRRQEVPWMILAGSQEALRRFQDAPTKLPRDSQDARGGSQVVSGSFMFRMSVVIKGSRVLGRVCISKFLGGLCVSQNSGSVGSSRRRFQSSSQVHV